MTKRHIHNLKEVESSDTFIILSAGIGRRMKGCEPKSLLVYEGKRIIDHQLPLIKKQSLKADVIVVGGFKFNSLLSLTCRLVENINYESTNACESLRLGINASIPSNLYIIHGDIIFNKFTISIPDDKTPYIVIDRDGHMDAKEVGVSHQDGKVLNMSYGLKDKWCQIAYIPRKHFELVRAKINTINKNTSTYEFINLLLDYIDFEIYENKKPIIEIDSARQL